MSTREQLEKKPLYRFSKVIFNILAAIVVVATLLIWYGIRINVFDATQAYLVCNNAKDKIFQLTDQEKKLIEDSRLTTFAVGSETQIRISKICYQDYSGGKDPELATSFDISLFKEMEKGADDRVYTIQGIRDVYHWQLWYLIIALIVEYGIFQGLKFTGLYVAGGKDAIS